MPDRLERARASLDGRAWGQAFSLLVEARREGELEAEDLERLAIAAYMTGNDQACSDAWMRAHQEWLRRRDRRRAASCAFRHALELFFRGDLAPAQGWVARGGRVLDGEPEGVERAWLIMLTALPDMFGGEASTAYPRFVEAGRIAERFGDPDASMFARLNRGQSLILQERTDEGMALLDEVMVAVTADEVSPLLAGIAYCQVIALCNRVFDLRRAREWTEALSVWCDSQPDIVPYRGNCLVHRCEIFQWQGAWHDALEAAERACEWLAGPPRWDSLGSAYYQLAEIQRLRGEYAAAENSYRQASLADRNPEPGMSLLHLARGRIETAMASIRRVMEEVKSPAPRSTVLPAYVEIALAADDVVGARAGAHELASIADQRDTPYLTALAAHAAGAVQLAAGATTAALTELRAAHSAWRDLDAPYATARVRVLIGLAYRQLGDEAGAGLEFDSAHRIFEELGAVPDSRRAAELLGVRPATTAGLSPRETEVLELVAAGMTNRTIADELFISEKTVARHVSNIFGKLGLSSRSGVTAYAYKHGLVR